MYKDSRGLWRHSVTIDGQRKVFSAKTKKDLLAKMAKYQGQKKFHSPQFGPIAEQWMEAKWDRISSGSRRSYLAPYREILQEFGDREISDITPNEIQKWINSLDLSFKSVSVRKSVLSMIYNWMSGTLATESG